MTVARAVLYVRFQNAKRAAADAAVRAAVGAAALLKAWGGPAEFGRDAHIYGGGLLVSIGAHTIYSPAGFIAFGALLIYIGLRRPG